MRRQSRLFAIAEYLRGRRTGTTAEALAERFGVTLRTIYRDLDALRAGNLPLRADRGRGGGYALDRVYALPPVNFTAREAALLVTLGRWARELRLMPFTETLESGLDKVRAALSVSAQRELLQLTDELKCVGVPAFPVARAVERVIEEAWFNRACLVIDYQGADGVVRGRRVRIESVVLERSHTLLNAMDLDKNEARQFRMDRVRAARLLPLGVQPARNDNA